jgi:AcrR family transcriptional regulator
MLDAAELVFAERGIRATTMDEIADRVGVTKPLIYDYFGSKEGLFAATIERARGQLLGAVISAWEWHPDLPVRDRIRAVVRAFFEFIDEHDRVFTLVRTEGALFGAAGDSVERIRQQNAKAFANGLCTQVRFATLPQSRVTGMAEILIGGCERLAVWRCDHPDVGADEAADLVMTTIWDGLAAVAEPAR